MMSYDAWKLDTPPWCEDAEPNYCGDCMVEIEEEETHCKFCDTLYRMTPYENAGKNSGILAFRSGNHYITLVFEDGSLYRYTKESAGEDNLRLMQKLAREGQGLNSFVSINRPPYVHKENLNG